MDEGQKKLVFIMFENEANNCWLNAALSLIAHIKTFKKIVESSPDSRIKAIISSYSEAMKALYKADYSTGQNIVKAKEMLLELQTETLEYLKLHLKFKPNKPDSAFCAVLNLIFRDNSNIKKLLNVCWTWRKHCTNCGKIKKVSPSVKPIITIIKVFRNFHPECPSSTYVCDCNSVQEMTLVYKEIPPCLIFHFENGAGTGTNFPTSFSIKGREYKLTGIIILEKSCDFNVNHFYTLIRNPVDNCWLECNDLEKKCVSFSPAKPEFRLKNVYMSVFEAFDNLDKINNVTELFDLDQEAINAKIEIICLSDENNSIDSSDSSETEVTNDGASKISLDFRSAADSHEKGFSALDNKYKPSTSKERAEHSTSASCFKQVKPTSVMHDSQFNISYKDTVDRSTRALNYKSPVTQFPELFHKKETSSVQNFEMSSNVSQDVSATNFRLPSKNSLDKYDTKSESDNNTCQDQVVDQSKNKIEAADSLKFKIEDESDCTKKDISFHPSVNYKKSMQKENKIASNVDNELSAEAVANPRLPNNFLNDRHNIETNSKKLSLMDKVSIECKKEFEKAGYSGLKSTNAFVNDKKENLLLPCNSDCVTEKAVVINDKPSSVKNVKEKEKKKKFQMKFKQLKTEDINSIKKKEKVITDDQAASFSLANEEITNNVLRGTKRPSNSEDFDNFEKRAKMSGLKNCSEETNSKILEEKDYADNKQNTQGGSSKINGDIFKNIIPLSDEGTLVTNGKTHESANKEPCIQSDGATEKGMKELDFAVQNTVIELFLQFNKPWK